MNNGEAYAIFKQIESDKYTDSDKLEAINRVLGAETHNGIIKDDLIAELARAEREGRLVLLDKKTVAAGIKIGQYRKKGKI